MRHIGAVLLAVGVVMSQGIPEQLLMRRVEVRNAAARGALCSDGQPAAYYYRNCSANWDRKPGCEIEGAGLRPSRSARVTSRTLPWFAWPVFRPAAVPDYCKETKTRWIVAFETGMTGCFDDASCAQRSALTPNATRPPTAETLFPSGALLPYAEANPNLYKSPTVLVPYCSSDLWAGNSTTSSGLHFRGRAIARAVLEDLLEGGLPGGGSLGQADQVTFVAGAGLLADDGVAYRGFQTLTAWASGVGDGRPRGAGVLRGAKAAQAFTGVCDGCLLTSWNQTLYDATKAPCLTGSDCRADNLAARGVALWAGRGVDPTSLLASLAPGAVAAAARSSGLLVQCQLLDATQLAGLGAWPRPATPSPAYDAFVRAFAAHSLALAQTSPYVFAAACSGPSGTAASPGFLYTSVPHPYAPGRPPVQDPLRTALPSFLTAVAPGGGGPAAYGLYVDTCQSNVSTSPFCNESGCRGGE